MPQASPKTNAKNVIESQSSTIITPPKTASSTTSSSRIIVATSSPSSTSSLLATSTTASAPPVETTMPQEPILPPPEGSLYKSMITQSALDIESKTKEYKCKECFTICENLAKLKQHHKDKHLKTYQCSYCNEKFFNFYAWELNESICFGKMLAAKQTSNEFHKYYTRSKNSNKSAAAVVKKQKSGNAKTADNNKNNSKITNRRITNDGAGPSRYNTYDIDMNGEYDDDNDDEDFNEEIETARSVSTSFTRKSSLSCTSITSLTNTDNLSSLTNDSDLSHNTDGNDDYDDKDEDENEDKDGDNSEDPFVRMKRKRSSIDSNRTGRSRNSRNLNKRRKLSMTKDSVRGGIRRRRKEITVISQNVPEFGYPGFVMTTASLYGRKKKTFPCPKLSCQYENTCLNQLMKHDVECHKELPLYYCKMCKKRFVRRFYLDQHLMYQNYSWYFCIYCEKQFSFRFELDEHLVLHRITLQNKCEICRLSFLTISDYKNHLTTNKHLKKLKQEPIKFERYDYGVKDKILLNQTKEKLQQQQQQQLQQQPQKKQQQQQPDSQQPDSQQQDSQPDSQQPDSQQPDSQQPDSQPDSQQPDSQQPDSQQPDSQQPDSQQQQNEEQQLQEEEERRIENSLSNHNSNIIRQTPFYKSEIKIIKSMNTKREPCTSNEIWKIGEVFKLLKGNIQNCTKN